MNMAKATPGVTLTRRVSFSAGHRYWLADLSEQENKALFGEWASPYNHGHNYILDVTIAGFVDVKTGMVVNIKQLDDIVRKEIVLKFDGKSLNDEVNFFSSHTSSVENILRYTSQVLAEPGTLPQGTELLGLRLEETPLLYGELLKKNGLWITSITRTYEFAAAHRLHSDLLSEQENEDLYGKCHNPSGHGHNFVLEVTIEGEPDPTTGMIANIVDIDAKVNDLVVEKYDHKHLNRDIPEFNGRVVTSEVLVEEIFKNLENQLPAKLSRVRLFETARSFFEVTAAA
jgi:6-pyruvoyltetrahydropterin/6-carboxytetrahydropterin synthase